MGTGGSVSRLDVVRLVGSIEGGGGVGGRFAGLGGQIGRVPLILSDGAGDWRLARGVLDLGGALRVADAAAPARFEPLMSDDVRLRLAAGRITAGGWLKTPAAGMRITRVTIRHDLRTGRGDAALAVPGIAFTPQLQPEALTRLTLGVIANVRGTVTGEGRIAWTPAGVTSTGTFGTDATDLAAAFGPVKGIRTTVRFTDLLGLVSAPGQTATIAAVNPGIAVTDGAVRYRLLADRQVAVESARWPFSGGELELEPTVLAFGDRAIRRMTFRVTGADAPSSSSSSTFKNVAVTGVFDGTVPIVFDATGGRIEHGRLAVRQAGGTLAYVGEISNKDLGMFGSLAFDALKADALRAAGDRTRWLARWRDRQPAAVRRDERDAEGGGAEERPAEPVLQPAVPLPHHGARPFRGLLNSARSLNDPRGLIDQAMPKPESRCRDRPRRSPRSVEVKRGHAMRRTMLTTNSPAVRLLPLLGAALVGSGCISVKAPEKPIEINLNVTIRQEVVVSLRKGRAGSGQTISGGFLRCFARRCW